MKKLLLPVLILTLLLAGFSTVKATRTSFDSTTAREAETEVIVDHQDMAEVESEINLAVENEPAVPNEDPSEDPSEVQNSNAQDAQPIETEKNNISQQEPAKTNLTQNQNLNKYVLDVISTYKSNNYPYLMNSDYNNYNGVTANLIYQGRIIAKAHPSGNKASHCSGITFEVFFKAMQQRNQDLGVSINSFNGMTWEELYDFMLTWYVAKGNKSVSNIAVAVEKYGIGKRITNLENVKAGDFIDISRENNTGHTAVFISWIRDKNQKIIGLKYWSSQESTNGINYKTEYFNILDEHAKKYGGVKINNVYIARIN